MYPTISDLLQDLLGISIPLPIQSFGFFVAIAFLAAAYVLRKELQRRESLGWLQGKSEILVVGAAATWQELLLNAVLGFLIGFKILAAILDWKSFSQNPQDFIMSRQGNVWGGLLIGAVFAYWKYAEKKKHQLPQPKKEPVLVMPHQRVGDFTVMAAIAGLVGAKLFDMLENWQAYKEDPLSSFFTFSGLTFYGGLIVAAVCIIWYARKKGISTWHLVDSAAPALMLAYGLGRIGCQVAGDGDWGIANPHPKPFAILPDWFWSYRYPHNVINEGVPIPGCTGPHCMILPQGVYPTPLYEIIMCLVLFSILWLIRKKISIPGMIFGIYLVMNGLERFLIEKIRVNTKYDFFGFHPTQAEIISALMIIAGLWLVIALFRRHRQQPDL